MVEPPSNSIQNYDDATRWIYERIDYERIRPRKTSTHFRLERVEKLLELIGSPQNRIPAVHIAGTKGKGSTSAFLASILRTSGITTGLYTSPHIQRFEERMRVDGAMPTPEELVSLVIRLKAILEQADPEIIDAGVTYFEVATLLAWMFFDDNNVAVAVLETGLGGRLDCTTVCRPILTIITNIGLDHTHILGDTLAKIAAEKAGIMKSGVPLLTWVTQPEVVDVIQEHATRLNCTVWRGGEEITTRAIDSAKSESSRITTTNPWASHAELEVPLRGQHQQKNAALASAAADFLRHQSGELAADWPRFKHWPYMITPETIFAGVLSVDWPLRFQICAGEPTVILDAAHNPDSIGVFLQTLAEFLPHSRTRVLIFASSSDKDISAMLKLAVPQFDHVILTRFENNPRAVAPEEMMQTVRNDDIACRQEHGIHLAQTPATALEQARVLSGTDGVVCGTGSIFVAAELLQHLTQNRVVA